MALVLHLHKRNDVECTELAVVTAKFYNLNVGFVITFYYEMIKPKEQRKAATNVVGIVKEPWELERMTRAGEITDEAYADALSYLAERSGKVTELEVAKRIKDYFLSHDSTEAFDTIVAFGEGSADIHHTPTNKALNASDLVMIDMGSKYDGYCMDMTRSFLYKPTKDRSGKYAPASAKKNEMLKDVLDSQQAGLKEVYAGNAIRNVDLTPRNYLCSKGYESIPHYVGHGVGTEIHEDPLVGPKTEGKLLEGMVITVEPGVYVKGIGGVRIEDTVVVTKDGFRKLTNSSYTPVLGKK